MGVLRPLRRLLVAVVRNLPLRKQVRNALVDLIRFLRNASSAKLHDVFNLVAIGALNVMNFVSLKYKGGFLPLLYSSLGYFVTDILFVGLFPESVKSPASILIHHLVTAAYMAVPYLYPQHRWLFSWALLVEVNTWLQIARRTFPIPGLNTMFYATWVGLRLVMYPCLMAIVCQEWFMTGANLFQRDPVLLLATFMQTFLTGMNYYWTAELLCKMSARKQRKVKAVTYKDKHGTAKDSSATCTVHVDARASADASGDTKHA